MGRCFAVYFVSFSTLIYLSLQPLWAYVPTISSSGTSIRWKRPLKLNFAGNEMNQSSVTPSIFFDAVVFGLQRWKSASGGVLNFDYWQGALPQTYPPNSEYNGQSSVYFASNANGDPHLSNNVLGMTQVWYNTDSGEILETDIVLNDRDFHFTNNPTDTSGYGTNNTSFTDGKSNVYIQNVLTHELGHALGLSHSGGLQSTMLYMESPEQAHLGCDELIAIHALYASTDAGQRGIITGAVVSESGTPLFGAHILAISQQRGTVLATALTDRSGKYSIGALEPGTYSLMVEPFYAGSQALPSYYLSSTPSICSDGTTFGRNFLTEDSDFRLKQLVVAPLSVTSAPTLTVHCDGTGGASIIKNPASRSTSSAPVLNNSNGNPNEFGIIDQIKLSGTNYYRLSNISGHLEIHAMAYSLYSPIHPSMTLRGIYGDDVATGPDTSIQSLDPVYIGDSGYMNRDSAIIADGLPPGDYMIEIESRRLQADDYPAGPISLDSVPFLIVTGSLNQGPPALSSVIPNNARCRSEEVFPPYSSPPGPPPQRSLLQENKSTGFCGTLQNKSDRSKPGPGASAGAIAGWFLTWVVMGLMTKAAILLHRNKPPVTLKG